MANDIATVFVLNGMTGDLAMAGGQLAVDGTLATAIVHSLFTDRRAAEDDPLPAGVESRRGWWGDLTLPDEGDQYGSKLWLLNREKQLPDTLRRAEEYAAEALQWLIDDGKALTVGVEAWWERRGLLALSVVVTLTGGDEFKETYQMATGGG